ncbi:MAG: dTDP-4-dehydrorhamnose 3,5-epimerase [Sporichthyaceae bacterium]
MTPSLEAVPLAVPGSWVLTPRRHGDDRGEFCEWFRADVLSAAIGHRFDLAQANCSVSRRGVLRGIHFADVPPGQAKFVTCAAGAVLDVVVDIRVGSPTFGAWDSVLLEAGERRSVYLAEGLGHGFFAMTDDATVMYLCSTGYAPGREHGIDPLDPAIGIAWPTGIEPVLSAKDAEAPSLESAQSDELLPRYAECQNYLAELRLR